VFDDTVADAVSEVRTYELVGLMGGLIRDFIQESVVQAAGMTGNLKMEV